MIKSGLWILVQAIGASIGPTCLYYAGRHVCTMPPPFFAQTPSFFAQPSRFARSQAAPRISESGSWNAPVEIEGNRSFIYNCCRSLLHRERNRWHIMAENYLGRQSLTGRGPTIGPVNISSCWQADRKWLARSCGTSVMGSIPSDWHWCRAEALDTK